jgi:hypothetical protein
LLEVLLILEIKYPPHLHTNVNVLFVTKRTRHTAATRIINRNRTVLGTFNMAKVASIELSDFDGSVHEFYLSSSENCSDRILPAVISF